MSYNYDLTFQDYKSAQKLYFRHCKTAGMVLRFWLYGLPSVACLLLITDLYLRRMGDSARYDPLLAPTFFFSFMSVWIVAFRPWQLRRCYKKCLPQGETKLIPVVFSFDGEGVVSSIPGKSEGRFFWAGIVDYAESSETALIFVREKNFLYIPKRAMDEEAWGRLRSTVQKHGIGKKLAD